jgi:hypothetical protein
MWTTLAFSGHGKGPLAGSCGSCIECWIPYGAGNFLNRYAQKEPCCVGLVKIVNILLMLRELFFCYLDSLSVPEGLDCECLNEARALTITVFVSQSFLLWSFPLSTE